ncbi:phage holin family protein [Rhodococcus koreensis]|uniref:phage holin family protein n=1 Tax=Rhodococcus koreensis TaxID=99653 RepID=UPI00197EB89A|nr:phage holin family protein [Rhodococcus koreensis]QSE83946.1 alkaline phosphatase family protein [Rhodococcus koreensis]
MRSLGSAARTVTEFLVLWLVSAVALVLTDLILPGVRLRPTPAGGPFDTIPAALFLALVYGLLSVTLWPLLVRAMLWVGPALLFLGVFAGNWLIMVLAVRVVPVATTERVADVLVLALVMSVVGSGVAGAIAARRDDTYRLMLVRRNRSRLRRRGGADAAAGEPGLLCIQIDGLGHAVLQRAIRDGVTPHLAGLVHRGSHVLTSWHTDWSSQTGASQLGILHGDNHNVPAFRWYDKPRGTVAVFSNPADNAARELERAHRPGLLTGGASRGNLVTGGADDNVLVVSRMRGARMGGRATGYADYFVDPASAVRTAVRLVAEVLRENVQAYRQRRADVTPRVRRGGLYPLVRAFTTVVETDVVVAAVVGDLIAGRSPVYVDLVGYDEVAHHSGVERPETRKVLRTLDDEIGMIAAVAAQAGRPYRIVVLSDHGQSQGSTFRDRYGKGLEDVVLDACHAPGRREGDSVTLGSRGRGAEGLGYAEASLRSEASPDVVTPGENPVVLASGNLGLVSFPRVPGRATREWIDARYPDLIPALVTHPGIGFVLVARDDDGSVVLGSAGSADVATGEVDGVDPLADFGPGALDRVRRTDTFDNVADLMVGGRYWPDTREVAAFEDQVGSHGGLGGPQNTPFLLYPADLPAPPNPLQGAEAVHEVLVRWRDLA